jgi:hypothetical protein
MNFVQRPVDDYQRQTTLSLAINWEVGAGARVLAYTPFEAVIARKVAQPNHLIHLILSIFTMGFWLPIWALVGITTRQPRPLVIGIDQYGNLYQYDQKLAQEHRKQVTAT